MSRDGFREWIPARERQPEVDGLYETLVKPLLEETPIKIVQPYRKQAHHSISGWRDNPVTHWRSV